MHLWPNLLGVFYPIPLGGRIASVLGSDIMFFPLSNSTKHTCDFYLPQSCWFPTAHIRCWGWFQQWCKSYDCSTLERKKRRNVWETERKRESKYGLFLGILELCEEKKRERERERVTRRRSRGTSSLSVAMKKLRWRRRNMRMRERERGGGAVRCPIKERESKKLKIVNIQRRFCENRLCFKVFKEGFVKPVFQMFIIFTNWHH